MVEPLRSRYLLTLRGAYFFNYFLLVLCYFEKQKKQEKQEKQEKQNKKQFKEVISLIQYTNTNISVKSNKNILYWWGNPTKKLDFWVTSHFNGLTTKSTKSFLLCFFFKSVKPLKIIKLHTVPYIHIYTVRFIKPYRNPVYKCTWSR